MKIMDIIKKFRNKDEYDETFEQLKNQRKAERTILQREKNSNERELERYYEEERQKMIKSELEKFRKQKNDEFWHSSPNLQRGAPILKNDRPILKEKNQFVLHSNNLKGKGIYFK